MSYIPWLWKGQQISDAPAWLNFFNIVDMVFTSPSGHQIFVRNYIAGGPSTSVVQTLLPASSLPFARIGRNNSMRVCLWFHSPSCTVVYCCNQSGYHHVVSSYAPAEQPWTHSGRGVVSPFVVWISCGRNHQILLSRGALSRNVS